jgi:uncharacterized protein YfdQ (DUF2303 family)
VSDEWKKGDIEAAIAAGRDSVHRIPLVDGVLSVVVPDGAGRSRVETLDTEKYMPTPNRATGNVALRDVESFITYVKRHTSPGTVVFASPRGRMVAVFNHHGPQQQPGWGDLTATLDRPETVAFRAWMRAGENPMEQATFANFLEERVGEIVQPDAGPLVAAAEHFRAHTITRFRSQQRLRDGQVQLEYVETVDGGAETDGKLTLPDQLTIAVKVYRDSLPIQFNARLRWRVVERKVMFSLVYDDGLVEALDDLHDATIAEVVEETNVPVLRAADAAPYRTEPVRTQ